MGSPERFAAVDANKPSQGPAEGHDGEEQKLTRYSPEQRRTIRERMRQLSVIPNHIGKDFEMEVELNEPGQGWHWDFGVNKTRVDPEDLLNKPLDHSRFVMAHEGGHRRVSRVGFIPKEEWEQPAFPFMMNSVEDPRDNNFVGEAYPTFKTLADQAYQHDLDIEGRAKEKATEKLGTQPRFVKAGFEYIKQWFRETRGEPAELSKDLPEDVRAVVEQTLAAARDSWLRYPTREEADQGEKIIEAYAKKSYEINRDKVWPLFKTLVDADMKDQEVAEQAKRMAGEQGEPGEGQPSLTEQEKQAIKDALSPGNSGEPGKPGSFDQIPEELKEKIRKAIDALPEDKKKELRAAAEKLIKEVGDEIAEELAGAFTRDEEKKSKEPRSTPEAEAPTDDWSASEERSDDARAEMRRRMEESLERNPEDSYNKALTEVAPLIDALTGDLRDVFVKRKLSKTEAGYRSGRRWNIRTRIKEKIAGIPLLKTQSREQVESAGEESDYAVLLQVDLSGSMQRDNKIREAFKSVVLLGETLSNLGIPFEIDGFQDILLEFKAFNEELDDSMREKLNQLPLEVTNSNPGGHNEAGGNDDGACLKAASEHLALQSAREKILIVLSDGQPSMDDGRKSRAQLDRELKGAVREIMENTDQKLIGVGINSSAVSSYYENNIPDVDAKELSETLGEILRTLIERG